ncbi:dienelactone hydrolase family protein [Myxococcus sp. K38C18041901]|uniref:dienelactone hydrolase family protein n=1 Tax=Myxococcus guangdongensis TaxID=2906760 RepID=UPI0020A7A283|nr:dienelactone hydrolase family protein [Myxococcus guangdongensis]MCP3058206.1 dienelactone hydrolase family protein [Myxococcus guangdongensis]
MRVHQRDVEVGVAGRLLAGFLCVPERASGLVMLVGDEELAKDSPVREVLHAAGLATLGLDWRTADEEQAEDWTVREGAHVELIAHRLEVARDWLQRDDVLSLLPVGFLGMGLGAAAVLVAAAHQPRGVQAVVTLGGRPDKAGSVVAEVSVPTLVLGAGEDADRAMLARRVFDGLAPGMRKGLQLVEGASRRFEESEPRARAARMAAAWFSDCFRAVAGPGVVEWNAGAV